MFGFLSGLSLWWKLGAIAVVIASALLWFRWQLNKSWEKGRAEGVTAGIEQIEQQKAAEWKAKEDLLAAGAQAVTAQAQALEAQRAELNKTRVQIKADFATSIEKLRSDLRQQDAAVAQIPSGELVGSIKRKLESLRSGDSLHP